MSEPSTAIFHCQSFGNRLATWFAATRPPFLTASILPVVAGIAVAWAYSGTVNSTLALLTLLNIALIHSGANVLNDYFDALNGSDEANTQRIFPFSGGSRFIQNGVLSLGETFRLGVTLMLLGIALGLGIAAISGPFILLIGLIGGLTAVFYTAPPCLVCRGVGDLAIALCFGVLPLIGTVYIQLGEVVPAAWWVGIIIGCFVAAILWVNSIPDIDADRKAGKRTLPVRLGTRLATYGLVIWFIVGFMLVAFAPLPEGVYLTLLAIIPASIASRALLIGKLIPAMPLTIVTHASVCILLTAGIALAHL